MIGVKSVRERRIIPVVWLRKVDGRASRVRQEFFESRCGGDMKMRFAVAAAVISLALSVAAQEGKHMVQAKGSFEVKMIPAEPSDFEKANDIGRLTSDKTWHGDFEGVSHVEMITGSTASTGSMAYVAIERVTGKLNGREGSFTFLHRGTMMKGGDPSAAELSVAVVPNSGTGELAGLAGSLKIQIDAQGKHAWTFDYSLP
jgi:hypothetical protein